MIVLVAARTALALLSVAYIIYTLSDPIGNGLLGDIAPSTMF